MDPRIEQAERRLIVVGWALHGMVVGQIEPESEDIDSVFMLVEDIRHDLRDGLEASLKEGVRKPSSRNAPNGVNSRASGD